MLNHNLHIDADMKFQRVFTLREQEIIERVRAITPKSFIKGLADGFSVDIRLLGMFALALIRYNSTPPREYYRTQQVPEQIMEVIIYGTERYITAFLVSKYSMIDISYSDSGLSISLDRVTKLKAALEVVDKDWLEMVKNVKIGVLLGGGGVGLATPRGQGSLSTVMAMFGMSTGSAMGWNLP